MITESLYQDFLDNNPPRINVMIRKAKDTIKKVRSLKLPRPSLSNLSASLEKKLETYSKINSDYVIYHLLFGPSTWDPTPRDIARQAIRRQSLSDSPLSVTMSNEVLDCFDDAIDFIHRELKLGRPELD